jgi:hypothetical protein
LNRYDGIQFTKYINNDQNGLANNNIAQIPDLNIEDPPVQFGIIMAQNLSIGLCKPPAGSVLFVCS